MGNRNKSNNLLGWISCIEIRSLKFPLRDVFIPNMRVIARIKQQDPPLLGSGPFPLSACTNHNFPSMNYGPLQLLKK